MLAKSELLADESDEEVLDWGQNDSENIPMELGEKADITDDDILNADTSNWDPFRDADKFEALAQAEQSHRKS